MKRRKRRTVVQRGDQLKAGHAASRRQPIQAGEFAAGDTIEFDRDTGEIISITPERPEPRP